MKRLRELLTSVIPSSDSVFKRSAKSAVWVTGIKWVSRMSELILLVVLARLLAPRDFGLMGIALLSLGALTQSTKIGLNQALIQQKEDDVDSYLDTTWCLEAGRGFLIFAVVFLFAPYVAALFSEPRATPLIRVVGLSPLLYGIRNPAVIYFQKELSFHKEFAYQTSGKITRVVVGISYALISPSVWALVAGYIAADVAKTTLSYILHPYRPWPAFDREAASELIDFGKWITASSILNFLYARGDDVFVGWFLSATALGFYQYAYRIADMPSTEVSEVIANVTFPAYSRFQDDPQRLRDALLRSLRMVAFVTYPMAFGIALVAPSFVPLVLGQEWEPMIVTMQLLSLYGLLHALTRNFGSIWNAIGRPDIIAKVSAIRVACIAVLIWPATARWGIEGTAAVVVGVYVCLVLPLDIYMTTRHIEVSVDDILTEFSYPLIPAATMFGTLWYVRSLLAVSPLVEFATLVPAGVVIYLLVAYVTDRQFEWGVENDITAIIAAVRS